jgi:hypothetical protein
MSKYEDLVSEKILTRAHFGLQKYGVSLEREDLTFIEWLDHAQEETMDLANYLEVLHHRPEVEDIKMNDVSVKDALLKAQAEILVLSLYLEALIQDVKYRSKQ